MMIISVSSVFFNLVIIGERIERNMKNGKLPGTIGATNEIKKSSSNFHKKKEWDTNAIMVAKRKNKAYHPLSLPFYQDATIAPNQYNNRLS